MSPWFRLATPVYKNTGSVARDHLASERTFLAWMRTGLGFVALGIAVERFSQLDLEDLVVVLRHGPHPQPSPSPSSVSSAPAKTTSSRVQGEEGEQRSKENRENEKKTPQLLVGTLLGMGSGSIVYGTARYFSNLRALARGLFKPAFHGVALLGAAVAGLAGGVYGDTLKRRMRREGKDDL
ncbi:hypothetical protein PG996_007033 [Apiospora saccharicola]|uniref:DUF202 domain-containing protein n=1 Tax=Apiospora saccharicola TaxID=335842 RepID=A0ABR1V9Q2_9PEZI